MSITSRLWKLERMEKAMKNRLEDLALKCLQEGINEKEQEEFFLLEKYLKIRE